MLVFCFACCCCHSRAFCDMLCEDDCSPSRAGPASVSGVTGEGLLRKEAASEAERYWSVERGYVMPERVRERSERGCFLRRCRLASSAASARLGGEAARLGGGRRRESWARVGVW